MSLFEPIPQDERYILDLVTFDQVLINYNKNFNLYVNFTLDSKLKGSTFDWIGIFKSGWDKYESFLAFEWGIGEPTSDCGRKRRIIFDTKELKSALVDTNYQFVYISKHLEILGVSQFFQFTDDFKSDSFCLNTSYLLGEELFSSTENPIKSDERSDSLDLIGKISPVKRPRPSCSINIPNNWEQVFTSCWKCKSLFEMKNKHNELIAKLNSYTEQNEKLKERLNKLEQVLEKFYIPKKLLEWDVNKERVNFQRFVSLVKESIPGGHHEAGDQGSDEKLATEQLDEIGSLYDSGGTNNQLLLKTIQDHGIDKKMTTEEANENGSLPYDRFPPTTEYVNNQILLKAIIGSQEDKIRELTSTIAQNVVVSNDSRYEQSNTDVVKLVTAKEKLIPEMVKVDSENDEKESVDENGNIDFSSKEHDIYYTKMMIEQEVLSIQEENQKNLELLD